MSKKSDVHFELKGWDKLSRKLENSPKKFRGVLKDATTEAIQYVHERVPEYPPPPPTSSYRRTGLLGRSITTEVREEEVSRILGTRYRIEGVIGTKVKYAPWVISSKKLPDGRGPQAKVHKNRWYTLQDVVKQAKSGIMRIYDKHLKKRLFD